MNLRKEEGVDKEAGKKKGQQGIEGNARRGSDKRFL